MAEEKKEKRPLTEEQAAWWDAIKDVEVNYYGLPDHYVSTICEPLNVLPESLYLAVQGPAVISVLTDALEKDKASNVKTASGKSICKYVLEPADKFVVLKPNPDVELKDYK